MDKEAYKQHLDSSLDLLKVDVGSLKDTVKSLQSTETGVLRARLAAIEVAVEKVNLTLIAERETAIRTFVVSLKKEVEVVLRNSGILPKEEHLKTTLKDTKGRTDATGSDTDGRGRFMDTLVESKRESARNAGERVTGDEDGAR